jgi:DNA-binding protein
MATREKYQKVLRQEKSEPNELRVSSRGNVGSYVTRALDLFDGNNVDKVDTVTLRGIDRAIPTVLAAAEIVRRRVAGLHQVNIITSTKVEERYEPLEEGLLPVVDEKVLSLLVVKLTLKPAEADLSAVGYLKPLDSTQVEESINFFKFLRKTQKRGR